MNKKNYGLQGKQKSSNDLFTGSIPNNDVNQPQVWTNGNPPRFNHSQSQNGISFTSERSPHAVPYDDEIT